MLRTLQQWFALVVVTGAIVLGGCLPQQDSQSSAANPSPTQTASAPVTQTSSPQASGIPRLEGKATVAIVVKGGTITAELDGTNAPITAGNFVDLVQRGVYNGLGVSSGCARTTALCCSGRRPAEQEPKLSTGTVGYR